MLFYCYCISIPISKDEKKPNLEIKDFPTITNHWDIKQNFLNSFSFRNIGLN
jgi:hypothetical protein